MFSSTIYTSSSPTNSFLSLWGRFTLPCYCITSTWKRTTWKWKRWTSTSWDEVATHLVFHMSLTHPQVDVYSFGMTLLELISGRRTVDLSLPSEKCFYAVWAYKELDRGQSMTTLVDEGLDRESLDEGELRRMLHVGLWCAQDDPEKRPTMRDVVKMLEGTLEVQDAPAPPSYAQTSDEGFHAGHVALFQPGKDSGDQDMNKISFEYTQTFSAR